MHKLLLTLTVISWLCFSQTIYVGIPGHGVWKSMDDSYTWFSVNENLPDLGVQCLAGIKYTMNHGIRYDLYAGTSSGVYRTTDGGITWQLIFDEFPNVARVKVDPIDNNIIYVGHRDIYIHGLQRSTDWGATWVDITPPADGGWGRSIAISPKFSNTIYVFGLNIYYLPYPITLYDLYKSYDRGNNWEMHSQMV